MEFNFIVIFCQIADLANEDTPQLYAACGRGPRSSMRVLRHGLEVRNQSSFTSGVVQGRVVQSRVKVTWGSINFEFIFAT